MKYVYFLFYMTFAWSLDYLAEYYLDVDHGYTFCVVTGALCFMYVYEFEDMLKQVLRKFGDSVEKLQGIIENQAELKKTYEEISATQDELRTNQEAILENLKKG